MLDASTHKSANITAIKIAKSVEKKKNSAELTAVGLVAVVVAVLLLVAPVVGLDAVGRVVRVRPARVLSGVAVGRGWKMRW